jgi:hypothetical protein
LLVNTNSLPRRGEGICWELFLQQDRYRKQAIVERLLFSISLVPAKHRAIWQQLIDDHQHHIADIDEMTERQKKGAAI